MDVAAVGTERDGFYGDLMLYIMERPDGSPNTVVNISKEGKTVIDANGYPEDEVKTEVYKQPDHMEKLPTVLRVAVQACPN
jgi:hypothetical protein